MAAFMYPHSIVGHDIDNDKVIILGGITSDEPWMYDYKDWHTLYVYDLVTDKLTPIPILWDIILLAPAADPDQQNGNVYAFRINNPRSQQIVFTDFDAGIAIDIATISSAITPSVEKNNVLQF